jgi:hypothetical protein
MHHNNTVLKTALFISAPYTDSPFRKTVILMANLKSHVKYEHMSSSEQILCHIYQELRILVRVLGAQGR